MESIEFYKEFIENANFIFIIISPDKKIHYINSKATKIFGINNIDSKSFTIFDIFSQISSFKTEEESNLTDFLNGKIFENKVVQVNDKNHSQIWINLCLKPIKNEINQTIGTILTGFDISRQVQLDQKLGFSEERYKSIFNSINSGVAVYEAVDDGKSFKIKDINIYVEKFEDVRKNDVVGKLVSDVFPEIEEFGLLHVFRRVWKSGISELHPLSLYKDNRIQGWKENYVYKLVTGEIVSIYSDLTEKKKQEQVLKESEEKFRLLSSNAVDAIVQIDHVGNIIYWNNSAKRMFGYEFSEVKGKNLMKLIASEIEDKQFIDHFNISEEMGQTAAIGKKLEFNSKRKDGSELLIEVTISSVKLEGKWNAISIIRDISERRNYENKLNNVLNFEKLLTSISSQFLGTIDFNQAINNTLRMIGISNMVSRVYLFSFDERKEYLMNTHEWCAEGIDPHLTFFKNTPLIEFPSVKEIILSGKFLSIENSLDSSMDSPNLRKILRIRGVQATLAYHIYTEGTISGFLGFDDEKNPRKWTPEDFSLLKVVSQIIGNALERKINEDKIKESEEKYRLISEDSDDLIIVFNDKMEIEYVNGETHARNLGYSAHLVWNLKFLFSILHQDDLKILGMAVRDIYKKRDYKIQIRYKHKKGHYIWYDLTGKIFYDKNGSIKSLVVGRDITDLKLVQEQLKESEQNLRERVKELNVLFEISTTMENGDLTIEESFHEILKKLPPAWQYPNLLCARIIYKNKIYKSINFQETNWMLSSSIKIGTNRLTIDIFYIEDHVMLKEEEQIIEEVAIRLKVFLEKKESEIKLKESEEKFRSILESINEGYFEVDLYGNFTFFNDALCEISGYSREVLLDLNYSEFCDEETKQYIQEEFNKLFKYKKGFKIIEYPQKKKNGEIIHVESSIYLKYDDNNKITGFKGFARNVSERKRGEALRKRFSQQLEEEVQIQTNQLTEALEKQKLYLDQIIKNSHFKTEFLSTMSHELRTPLNAIIGFTDLLLEGVYGNLNNAQLEFINDIKSSAEQQFSMISQILDISNIESGQNSLKLDDIHLYNFINNIISTLRPLINEKELVVEMRNIKKKLIVKADTLKLKHILENILSNAIKFTEKGYIIIEFSFYKDEWELLIKDSGIGITEENFGLIFKDFKRVKSPFVDSVPGSGLGLALTKRIVELHGGRISFSSKIDEGTTFRIRMPKNPLSKKSFLVEQFLRNL